MEKRPEGKDPYLAVDENDREKDMMTGKGKSMWMSVRTKAGVVIGMTRSRTGFTLLELVISITLVATIVLIATGAMRLGYRSVTKGEKRIESLERFRSSISIVSAQIESGIPLSVDDGGVKRFYFEGSGDRLKLATNYSIWGGQKGYISVEYRVQDSPDGTQWLHASESSIGAAFLREARLFQGLTKIRFEYYYKDPTEESGEWTDVWDDETKMPQKVRLWLVEGRREMPIILPLRAQAM
jgi:general secretion pathway protein J